MPKPTYFTPDTNILVRSWTQGKAGCEMECWSAIKEKCASGALNLLISEVVLLESEKQWQQLIDEIDTRLKAVEKSITDMFIKTHDWTEIKDVGQSLIELVISQRDGKKKNAKLNHDEIDELLRSSMATILPFTAEVYFSAKRRLMSGKFPKSRDRNSEADCAIIESLLNFFKDQNGQASLLFCSENHTDFGLELNGQHVIHPLVGDGLPPTVLCPDLQSLIKFINEAKPIAQAPIKEIEKAVARERNESIDDRVRQMEFEAAIEKVYGIEAISLDEVERKTLSHFMSVLFTDLTGFTYLQYRDEMRSSGFDDDQSSIVLARLKKKGMVEQIEDRDWNGNQSWIYRITEKGQNWCLENHQLYMNRKKPDLNDSLEQSKRKLRVPTPTEENDDIPF